MAGNGPTLRAYQASDLERLRAMHAKQGFNYELPDLSDPTFTAGTVAEDENGVPQGAIFLRITAEAYLLADPQYGTPRDRWRIFLNLHESVRWQARELGLHDVHAFLPPELGKGFDRRLGKLGWTRDAWRVLNIRLR